MIDHCVGFFQKKQEEKLYRVYVTDALKALCDNTSKMISGKAVTMNMRYKDLIDNEPQKEDTRTAEEVINHITDKLQRLKGE